MAALASIVATTAASSTPIKDEKIDKTNMDIASAAILVTVQCVEAAKAMWAKCYNLASVVSSAANVHSISHDCIATLTSTAAIGNTFYTHC